MRASRLLSILITLQLRGRVAAAQLAEQLEVSRRTILRDMDELSAAGIPIYAERGRHGGFVLHDGYRTGLTGLNVGEHDAIPFIGLPALAADLGISTATRTAKLKLAAASSNSVAAERATDRFHFDPTDWYRKTVVIPHLRAIADAVWSTRRVRIDYESWRSRRWRDVAPLGLVLKGGQWYLVADAGLGSAIFKLQSVHGAELLDPFERPRDFDLASTWSSLTSAFEKGLLRSRARLRVYASAMDRVDRLGTRAAEIILSTPAADDGFREAEIPIESIGHAAGLLLGFVDEVEVLTPLTLRDELRRRAALVVALYQ